MKKIFRTLILVTLMLCLLPTITVSADTINQNSIIGAWYGQYVGGYGDIPVDRYMNMTIKDCDNYGNISGVAAVTTVEGQGYDYQWINYNFQGKIDLQTLEFFMQGTTVLSSNDENWQFAAFHGKLTYNQVGEMYVEGLVDDVPDRTFWFGHVSEWAKDEITEANINNLIPDTMKNKDLSKPITRAEFAAVANQLHEILTGTPTPVYPSTFVDITGNADEESIKKAHALNITVGYSDTIFAPDEYISREQLATMLTRAIKKYKYPEWSFANDGYYTLDTTGVPLYSDDAFIADYAKQSVYYMTKMGIINGLQENLFGPKNITDTQIANNYATATREQAIAIAFRIFKMANDL